MAPTRVKVEVDGVETPNPVNWLMLLFFVALAGLGLRDLIAGEAGLDRAPYRLTGIAGRILGGMVFLTGIAFTYWVLVNWNSF